MASQLPLKINNGQRQRFVASVDSLPNSIGGTGADTSATGGANQIVKQSTLGGAFSIAALLAGDIPSLSAAIITSGTLAVSVGGTGANLSATGGAGQYAKQATSGGAFTVGIIPAADLPNHSAVLLTSGNVALSVLGTGTPAAGKYVDGGTGAWTAIPTPTENVTLTNDEATALLVGNALYSDASGGAKKAKADSLATANAIGLSLTATAAAGVVTVQTTGTVTLTTAQWDAVTGQTGGLVFNSRYFLDAATAGKITSTPPNTTGQQLCLVGKALSTTTLLLSLDGPDGL